MIRKYDYIVSGTRWDETTIHYIVAIGTSLQGHRDFDALTKFAADHGHFFALRSASTLEFIKQVDESLAEFGNSPVHITARDLVRQFRHGLAPTLSQEILSAAHKMRYMLNLDYRISSNLKAAGK